MIHCSKCKYMLLTIQESSYLDVRGEVELVVLCPDCSTVNYVSLFEYNKERISK